MKFPDFLPFDEASDLRNREEMWENKNLGVFFLLLFQEYELCLGCSSKECPEEGKPQLYLQTFSYTPSDGTAWLGEPVSAMLNEVLVSLHLHLLVQVESHVNKTALTY